VPAVPVDTDPIRLARPRGHGGETFGPNWLLITRETRMSAQLEKTALFIDGANLYATAKALGFDIDYKRLLREFQFTRLSAAGVLLHRG